MPYHWTLILQINLITQSVYVSKYIQSPVSKYIQSPVSTIFVSMVPGLRTHHHIRKGHHHSHHRTNFMRSEMCIRSTVLFRTLYSEADKNCRQFADDILNTCFIYENVICWLKFHWNLFPWSQLTMSHHWFRQWHDEKPLIRTNDGLVYWHICVTQVVQHCGVEDINAY